MQTDYSNTHCAFVLSDASCGRLSKPPSATRIQLRSGAERGRKRFREVFRPAFICSSMIQKMAVLLYHALQAEKYQLLASCNTTEDPCSYQSVPQRKPTIAIYNMAKRMSMRMAVCQTPSSDLEIPLLLPFSLHLWYIDDDV